MEKEFKNLEDVEIAAAKCKECNLYNPKCKSVFAKGNLKAKIMLIGEAPGEEENKEGKPFVGKAGIRLDGLLTIAGFNPNKDIYFCNTVKCRPLNNRNPLTAERKTCRKFLDAQIKFLNPKIIILCGKIAAKNFGFTENLKKSHGKCCTKNGVKYFIIYHPIASISNEIKIKDLKKIKGEM